MKKSLNIALDFDDTFTADPVLWTEFVKNAHKQGHQVYVVTMRHDHGTEKEEVEKIMNGWLPVVYCCRQWKKDICEIKGIKIDIWIDDNPAAIIDQRDFHIIEYSNNRVYHIWDWLDGKD